MWCDAVLLKSCQVGGGTVALVLVKTISRVLFMELEHEVVACHFGDDGGGGD